jgi:hypothetical protein
MDLGYLIALKKSTALGNPGDGANVISPKK